MMIKKRNDMDYEKKYKEALKWMREIYPTLTGADKEDAEHYFPELKESEDERIRRTLVEYFGPQAQLDFVRGVPIQKIRDWLEKQKEPNYTKRSALFDKCVENCDPEIMQRVSDEIDAELQKEQKPAEWSWEDEAELCNILAFIKNDIPISADTRREFYYWLKSLRHQYHRDVTMTEAYKMGLEAGKASSWKPSEEQMDWLATAVRMSKDKPGIHPIIESLYNDLKKIM